MKWLSWASLVSQAETAQDDSLRQRKEIVSGWPDTKKEVLTCFHPYFLVRDKLSGPDELIFKGQRCVIPLSLRPRINGEMRGTHTGIQSCLRQKKETVRVCRPGLNSDPTDHNSKCDIRSFYPSKQGSFSFADGHEVAESTLAKDWRRCFHTRWYRSPLCG